MGFMPEELKFSRSHQWIGLEDDFTGVCGLTDFAQEKLNEIVYVDIIDKGLEVRRDEIVATVESYDSIHKVISLVNGEIIEVNEKLERMPGLINRDPYGEGWIFKIDIKYMIDLDDLMDAFEYEEFLISGE